MRIYSLLATKKFIITTVINILFLFLIGLAFSAPINASLYSLQTWKNCENTYVAYDTRKFDKNCYYYYGKKVSVNLSTGDSIRLNAEVYQFIEGGTYDNGSLINEKNVVLGEFKILGNNEIAIPVALSKRHNLTVGDKVYLFDRDAYEIKYVFRDIYDIKKPSIYATGNAVFVGGDANIAKDYTYALFATEAGVYNEVYTFGKAKAEFLKTAIVFICATCALTVALQMGIILFFRKAELKNLYKDCISGSRANYMQSLFGVNALLHILPSLLVFGVLLFIGNLATAVSTFATVILLTLIKLLYLRVKVH